MDNVVYAASSYMGPPPTEMTPDTFATILVGLRGTIYALDKTDGNQIWSYQTGGAMYSSPAVVDEVLYIGSMDSKVYAFGSATQPGSDIPITYIIAAIAAIIIAAIVVVLLLRRQKK